MEKEVLMSSPKSKYNIFADLQTVCGKTIAQMDEAMSNDFAIRGALMPDAHAGYALPIGAVVESKDVVVPAWVGYDIGCLDKDTEFLTTSGWVKISDYNNQDIMIYDRDKDICFYEKPNAYIVNDCKEFYHLDNGVVDQMLTHDHNVLMFSAKNKKHAVSDTLVNWVERNQELAKGVSHLFKHTLPLVKEEGVDLSDDEIRLIIAIQADGSITRGNVRFHLKKDRKVQRLYSLMEALGIGYKHSEGKHQDHYFEFNFSKMTKSLDFVWSCSQRQLEVVADEVKYWDSHEKEDGRIYYSSTDIKAVNAIQYAFSCTGKRSSIANLGTKDEGWADTYVAYTCLREMSSFPKPEDIKVVPSEDGKSYCFNTTTGYWVMRRGGKITITGNCGVSCSVLANVKVGDFTSPMLETLKDLILKYVPVGNARYKPDVALDFKFKHYDRLSDIGKDVYNSRSNCQLGTLGGGNHFIEIGVDRQEHICITIHSGSRGFGHGLADKYMRIAAEANGVTSGNLEKSFALDAYSDEGKMYISDALIAQGYALLNRKLMTETVTKIISGYLNKRVIERQFINRNHNHVEPKGDGVFIHRKGATHAEQGMLGVIPGNMRDGCFIVEGLGNESYLCSSSHGAGRVLSRGAAKKAITLEMMEKEMEGIVGCISAHTIDESPSCYKNIFDVMDMQKRSVKILNHIVPLVNIKG